MGCVLVSVVKLVAEGSASIRATCIVLLRSYNSALMSMFSNSVSGSNKSVYSYI